MSKDLKQGNAVPLGAILLATFIVIAAIQVHMDWLLQNADHLAALGLVAIATAVAGVLANVLPAGVKHAVVFAGHRHALPGHRCHRLCTKDPRLDIAVVRRQWPELFSEQTSDSERNAIWFNQVYSSVKNTPEVRQSHRAFLLYRDATAAVLLLLLIGIAAKLYDTWFANIGMDSAVLILLALETLALMAAARACGNRMVVNAAVAAVGTEAGVTT